MSATSTTGPTSWKMEVHTKDGWSTNAMRYATEFEASAAGKELLSRWIVPDDSRAMPSEDPVNARFNFETYKPELLARKLPLVAA